MNETIQNLREAARIGAYHAGLFSDLVADTFAVKDEITPADRERVGRKIAQIQICLNRAKEAISI